MRGKLTTRVWKEREQYFACVAGSDIVGQGASEEEALANLWGALHLHYENSSLPVRRSIEDVFGKFQGEVVFVEDADAPTIDEWPEV